MADAGYNIGLNRPGLPSYAELLMRGTLGGLKVARATPSAGTGTTTSVVSAPGAGKYILCLWMKYCADQTTTTVGLTGGASAGHVLRSLAAGTPIDAPQMYLCAANTALSFAWALGSSGNAGIEVWYLIVQLAADGQHYEVVPG